MPPRMRTSWWRPVGTGCDWRADADRGRRVWKFKGLRAEESLKGASVMDVTVKAGAPRSGARLWGDDADAFQRHLESLDERMRRLAEGFYTRGYLHLRDVVSHAACDRAIESYEKWWEMRAPGTDGGRPRGRTPRVINLHSELDAFKDLFVAPDLLDVLDLLFGYRASVYTSLTFKYGTEQPLHRDTPVFRTEPEEFYFGAWVALEDADEENGCLMALEGGHRGGRVPPFEFAEARLRNVEDVDENANPLWNEYQEAVVAKCESEGAVRKVLPARKGDVVIWHPQLPHGGSPIRRPGATRYSTVFHVVPEGTPVYQGREFFIRARSAPPDRWERGYDDYEGRLFMKTGGAAVGGN